MAMAWWNMGVGPSAGSKEVAYTDDSSAYANAKNLYINFLGVGTGRAARFKAFLTDFSDDFASTWNEEEVFGRMDPITTFQSTKRSLTFAFDVPSASYAEAVGNLRRLSLLIGLLYPGYSGGSATAISTAPLFKVSFTNWINTGDGGSVRESGLVGAIKGFNFTPDFEAGFWDDPQFVTPKLFKVSCNMTVLHTDSLGWSGSNWRGAGAGTQFPYGAPFMEQPTGLEIPDKSVTQNNDDGTSGTDEMVAAAEGDILGSTTTVEWTESGLEQQVGKEKADEIKAGMSD